MVASANISFNPNLSTVTEGMFNTSSVGLTQGTAYPDPAIRFKLAGGVLSASESLPMWGGVGLFTDVPGGSGLVPNAGLGPVVGRATSLANLIAFSVFDQAYGMINTPQSPVPLAAPSMQVMYYRLGSGARIAVAADPSLVSLRGGLTTQDVSWDFVNQKLIPYVTGDTISSGTYNSTSGLVTLTLGTTTELAPGDTVTVSGATGTGSFASINGTFEAGVGTGGTTVTYTIAPSLTLTITGGSLGTSGILPVQVLDVQATNCQIVEYNSGTGFATWNFDGAAAVILI